MPNTNPQEDEAVEAIAESMCISLQMDEDIVPVGNVYYLTADKRIDFANLILPAVAAYHLQELIKNYECPKCSTPGFIHLVIPRSAPQEVEG